MMSYSTHKTGAPTVTFWGAAQSVTGSMHLVQGGPTRILLDCGLVRGEGDEPRQRNRTFPFDPASLTAVVLSHAHVDHCGNLPNLVRQGFSGPIYCTPATRDLIAIMLADSARIQESDAAVATLVHASGGRRHGKHGGRPSHPVGDREPLYTRQDVHRTIEQCVTLPCGPAATITDDCQVRFIEAGHILGSAMVALTLHAAGRDHRITFTGDVGRRGLPYLRDPSPVPAGDLVICESTYGGRTHDTVEGMAAKLSDVVRRTVARGGKVLVPAFSLGRTQVVAHYFRHWMRDGVLPHLPIYIDSPLATHIGKVYEKNAGVLNLAAEEGAPPVEYLHTPEEARERSQQEDPCVIIASGGMCEGGRIVQHLRLHIDDPRSSVVLVSYQAPHSVGARLLEHRPTVRFHGRNWNKWVEVAELNGFSGHADQNDFVALLGPAVEDTGRVRLVHGEPAQAEALAGRLRKSGFSDVGVPKREETVDVA